MLTDIELLKIEVERLRKENEMLRIEAGRKGDKQAFPKELLEQRGNLIGEFITERDSRRGKLFHIFMERESAALSRTVRIALFPKTRKDGKRSSSYISCDNMSDDQYSVFYETMDKVLDALDCGRGKTKMLDNMKVGDADDD